MTKPSPDMRLPTILTPTPTPGRRRPHPLLTAFLLLLCIPIFTYQLVPAFTHATDNTLSILVAQLRGQASRADFCTREVGDAHCCVLFVDAMPCTDECQKQFVNRQTFTITKEYDECESVCLAKYNAKCKKGVSGNPIEGTTL